MKNIFITFAYSLLLTLAFELLIALLFRLKRRDILLLLLLNILTNPAAVYLDMLCQSYVDMNMYLWQLLIEISVVLTEGAIYRSLAADIRRPFLFSLCANAFSYGCGVLLNIFI